MYFATPTQQNFKSECEVKQQIYIQDSAPLFSGFIQQCLCSNRVLIMHESISLQPLQSWTTLISNLWSALPPFHLPFHLRSLSISPRPCSFSSSYLCLCLLSSPSPWWPTSESTNMSAEREWKRRERGDQIQQTFKTWQQKSTSVWVSQSNSPALIIFKEAHVESEGFQHVGKRREARELHAAHNFSLDQQE